MNHIGGDTVYAVCDICKIYFKKIDEAKFSFLLLFYDFMYALMSVFCV